MSPDRRLARIAAMQILSHWDVHRERADDGLDSLFDALEVPGEIRPYAELLVRLFWGRQDDVDRRIRAALTDWDFSRVSLVERNVMRVAVAERLSAKIPPNVTLNEAIEIGKEFGGADSPGFINGVLDRVFRDWDARVKEG